MNKIYTFRELKESKLIYDRKPPAFGMIITLITTVFVVGIIVFAGFATKTYVVKATGLVVSADKVNVMNQVSGRIEGILVSEGQEVSEGDVLIEIDGFQTELQIAQLEASAEFYEKKVGVLERLVAFINGFTLSEPNTRSNPFDIALTDEAKVYSDAQTFIDYIAGQEESAKNNDPPTEYAQTEADSLKTQFLSQQYTTLEEYQKQFIQYDSQAEMYRKSLFEYTIKAARDGVIHLTAGLTVGTVIQAGLLLGSIGSGDASEYRFDAVLSATDRSKVAVGNTVEIALAGVSQSEYGVLTGKILAIDFDSTQTEKGEVFYRVSIKPDETTLKSGRGSVLELKTGMIAESRIKYDETTWLKWAVEQIGVKFR
ncbi:MAG: HlyD family secretion protein [Clostridiales bacterium]|jgi:multidrug efflux pump subunit AcrA (membrane-fusion protein)|nr:HlyD family secretion protein [Clostridiales bacterium]